MYICYSENNEEEATMEMTGIHAAIAKDLPRVQVYESVRNQVGLYITALCALLLHIVIIMVFFSSSALN